MSKIRELVKQPLFKFSLILLITAVAIFPSLGMISTYYHEKEHIEKAKEYGINFVYNFDFKKAYFSSFNPQAHPSGVSIPATDADDTKYRNLDRGYKKEINLAGIKSDYHFINAFLLGMLLINLSFLFKKFRQSILIYFIVYLDITIFYWLWYLISSSSLNLFHPLGDLQKLFY